MSKTPKWEKWMPSPLPPEAEAFTADGYIQDQDCLHAYSYRTIPACLNCCGPAAIFNLRLRAGQHPDLPEMLLEMERMHLFHVPGPTRVRVMRLCLDKYLPGWQEIKGRSRSLHAAANSEMGIFRYRETGIPHYVAYYAVGGGRFRFFNVSDQIGEDCFSMDRFGLEHCICEPVRLFFWPAHRI